MEDVVESIVNHRMANDQQFLIKRFVEVLGLDEVVVARIVNGKFPDKQRISMMIINFINGIDLEDNESSENLQRERQERERQERERQERERQERERQERERQERERQERERQERERQERERSAAQATQATQATQGAQSSQGNLSNAEIPPNFFLENNSPYSTQTTSQKIKQFRDKVNLLGFSSFDYKRPAIKFELIRDKKSQYIRLMEDSFAIFGPKWNLDSMKKGFQIKFHGEDGIDWGGLQREWFFIFTAYALRPSMILFREYQNNTYMPSPFSSEAGDDHFEMLKGVGRAVGLALYTNNLIGGCLTRSFCKTILGIPLSFSDLKEVDPELYENLSNTLKMNPEDIEFLCRTFSEDIEFLGMRTTEDLIPNGRNIDVTHENLKYYIYKLTMFKLSERIKEQTEAFLKGFYEVIPKVTFQGIGFTAEEFSAMLTGSDTIDVEDWQKNSVLSHFPNGHKVPIWFFEILREFNHEQRQKLLSFSTSLNKVPVRGFGVLEPKFTLRYVGSTVKLPVSHTCFNYLDLTDYPSKDKFREYLIKSINEAGDEFNMQ